MSLPKKTAERIQYVEQHIEPFTTNVTAIGLVNADVTDLETKAAAARAAFNLRESLRQQAEAVTLDLRSKLEAMNIAWASCTDKIKGKAKQVGGTSVYTLAQVPAPATPSPVGAPGEATSFKATLMVGGDLDLGWKCANPANASGTTYQVFRRFTPSAGWDFLGATGEKKFIDATIPAGVSFVMYKIRGIRSTVAGPWAEFNVTFGAGAVGSAMVTAVTAPKMAA
ncbi:MAG TPA: hypothetical protein VGR35_02295 [Tepidisphaeraceae bacterium]|nr:hypothetical protein [Tepidisphaeraceae bacterium]